MTDKQTVVVATYEHKHGRDLRVFKTAEAAEIWRCEIAADWWTEWMDGEYPANNPKQAADDYFEKTEAYEWFSTEIIEVEG